MGRIQDYEVGGTGELTSTQPQAASLLHVAANTKKRCFLEWKSKTDTKIALSPPSLHPSHIEDESKCVWTHGTRSGRKEGCWAGVSGSWGPRALYRVFALRSISEVDGPLLLTPTWGSLVIKRHLTCVLLHTCRCWYPEMH